MSTRFEGIAWVIEAQAWRAIGDADMVCYMVSFFLFEVNYRMLLAKYLCRLWGFAL